MLEIRGVEKNFNNNKILKGIDLTVNDGDVIAILGPSGSGKTTFLRCISLLNKPDGGIVDFDGTKYDLAKIKKKEMLSYRRKTGFVFQNYNLFANKTVLENVTIGLTTVRKVGKKEAEVKALECLQKVGLADKAKSYPSQLSGGQQQRVSIARAMAYDPSVIFFDEPTSALDPELTQEVLQVIKTLADEGKTMIIVTHEINFARKVANRIVFIEDGEILVEKSTEEFFENPGSERICNFINISSGHTEEYVQTGAGI